MILDADSWFFKAFLYCAAAVGLAIATLPIITIVVMSFSSTAGLAFPPESLSYRWYVRAMGVFLGHADGGDGAAWDALRTSLIVGGVVMVLSTAACVPLAYALDRGGFTSAPLIEGVITLPLLLPLVVLGLAFLLLAEAVPYDLGLVRLVIPHLTLALPFVLKNCLSSLNGVARDIEEAAVSLGSSPFRAAVDVVLPLMKPGVLAGMTFAFVVSFNEFTVTYFMYTIDVSTLPLWMYSRTVSSLDPTVLALSSCIIALDLVVILAIDRVVGGARTVT